MHNIDNIKRIRTVCGADENEKWIHEFYCAINNNWKNIYIYIYIYIYKNKNKYYKVTL